MIDYVMILARKYARAYLNLYASRWTKDHVIALIQFSHMFDERRIVTAYLKISCIPHATKITILLKSLAPYHLDTLLEPLIKLLAQHHRLEIFGEFLHTLCIFLEDLFQLEEITIRTAAPLSDDHRRAIIAWVEQVTHKQLNTHFIIDPRLIAGIRLEGKDFFWEHSIRQQLRRIASIC